MQIVRGGLINEGGVMSSEYGLSIGVDINRIGAVVQILLYAS